MFAGDQTGSVLTKPGVQPVLVVFYGQCTSCPFAANLGNIASLFSENYGSDEYKPLLVIRGFPVEGMFFS